MNTFAYVTFFANPCCRHLCTYLQPDGFSGISCLAPAISNSSADLLIVVGQISHKQAPRLKRLYDNMLTPKLVLSLTGAHAMAANYAVLKDLWRVVPIDIQIDSCPIEKVQIEQALLHYHPASKSLQ